VDQVSTAPSPSVPGATKFVFDFSEGDRDQKDLLGGKGANLAEMARLGLPVPPGFTISTEACRAYLASGSVQELEIVLADSRKVLAEVADQTGVPLRPPLGTMIELPRAAMTAGQIAEAAEFFSFGTNDLTQTTWGFSRDDVEAAFFSTYLEMGIFGISPFETLDIDGVGELVKIGTERGRAARPELKIGICGEHGGDPDSVHYFHDIGLDYVSCSPFHIPVARLEAARATLNETARSDSR